MQQQDKAEHYRKEANRCADLAQTAQLAFLSEIYRKAAVRYVLMAEEAERPDPVRGGRARMVSRSEIAPSNFWLRHDRRWRTSPARKKGFFIDCSHLLRTHLPSKPNSALELRLTVFTLLPPRRLRSVL
jgi:hypothetical protein